MLWHRLSDLTATGIDFPEWLDAVGKVASGLVPSSVGVSITVVLGGDPFTITATKPDLLALDAAQYLDDGPCVEASKVPDTLVVDDVLDEDRWHMFTAASARYGIRSTLSLPIHDADGLTSGALNFYASEPDAFAESRDMFGAIFDASATDMVSNADLSFLTLDYARDLERRVEAKEKVERAAAILAVRLHLSVAEARRRLLDAAARAGAEVTVAAEMILILQSG